MISLKLLLLDLSFINCESFLFSSFPPEPPEKSESFKKNIFAYLQQMHPSPFSLCQTFNNGRPLSLPAAGGLLCNDVASPAQGGAGRGEQDQPDVHQGGGGHGDGQQDADQ